VPPSATPSVVCASALLMMSLPSIGLMVTVGSVSATVTAWLASVD
jgi:hypothetical protein